VPLQDRDLNPTRTIQHTRAPHEPPNALHLPRTLQGGKIEVVLGAADGDRPAVPSPTGAAATFGTTPVNLFVLARANAQAASQWGWPPAPFVPAPAPPPLPLPVLPTTPPAAGQGLLPSLPGHVVPGATAQPYGAEQGRGALQQPQQQYPGAPQESAGMVTGGAGGAGVGVGVGVGGGNVDGQSPAGDVQHQVVAEEQGGGVGYVHGGLGGGGEEEGEGLPVRGVEAHEEDAASMQQLLRTCECCLSSNNPQAQVTTLNPKPETP
jgi:hypothetical protein